MSSIPRIETAEPRESQLAGQQPFGTMSISSAADFLGISPEEVDRFCQAGTLRAHRSRRGYWIIHEASLAQWREANPAASAPGGELEKANEPRAVPPVELAPCPRGACEAHWERRRRVVPEYRVNLCRPCFLGRPLPPKAEEEVFDPELYRAPFANAQLKSHASEVHEPLTREAMEKERGVLAIGVPETLSVSAAAQIAGCSPDTMLRLIERGAIEARRISSRGWWRVERSSLTRFLDHGANNMSSFNTAPPASSK